MQWTGGTLNVMNLPRALMTVFCCKRLRTGYAIVTAIGLMQNLWAITGRADTLNIAEAAPNENPAAITDDHLDFILGDQFTIDDNVYRVPPGNAYFSEVVGPNASREDHIETATAGVESQWTVGQQIIELNARLDDNRYARNDDLDNISGLGKLDWNWHLATVLSGQIGTDYSRALPNFAYTSIYVRELVDLAEYFAAGRYQIGPRWAVFGGVLHNDTTISATVLRANDSHGNSGNVGAEYALGIDKTVGFEYRYTNTEYAHAYSSFNTDYRENTARILLGYALTDKTQIRASVGYLDRDYVDPNSVLSSFSGDVWRGSVQWQASHKTQIVVAAWRELQAYFNTETDYFVSRGESVAPVWTVSEKVSLSLTLSSVDDKFAGSSLFSRALVPRHDTINAGLASIVYTPTQALSFTGSYQHEKRNSNQIPFTYDDNLSNLNIAFKF
jgi:exopolysaccharide biosynthesis operon protein EpsL